MLQKSYTWWKWWYGCHIWIPLIFLIDLDILFVKFRFTDLKIWIISYSMKNRKKNSYADGFAVGVALWICADGFAVGVAPYADG